MSTKQQAAWWLGVLLGSVAAAANAAGAFKITLDTGTPPHLTKSADGSTLGWIEFYKNAASGVSVGRSDVSGTLPLEHLVYTDFFYIAKGSATLSVEGKDYSVQKGEFILLPRGATLSGQNFRDYVHFAASFETQPDAKSNGPLELRRVRPDQLKASDFVVEGKNMRHVYYQGAGGVVVRAWQSTDKDMSTDLFTSPWTELGFVTAGTGTITNEDGTVVSLQAGDSFLIPKGAKIKLSTHELRKVAVVFEQDASAAVAK